MLLAIAAGVAACQIVAGIERVEKLPATVTPPPPPTPPDPCAHVEPPPEPETDDDPTGSVPPFYVAFREVRFARPNDPIPGFDLDSVCTCETRPHTAFDGGGTCIPPEGAEHTCDEDGGIDNTLGSLFDIFGTSLGGNSPGYIARGAIEDGERTALVFIGDWNGKGNDKVVDVGFLPSQGIYDPSGCNNNDAGSSDTFRPGWCGKDRWSFPAGTSSERGGVRIPALHGPGAVRGGYLNFRPSGRITFFIGRASLTIGSPYITAKLDTDERGVRRLNGVLAGRVAATEILGALGQLTGAEDPITGEETEDSLCETNLFNLVKPTVCQARDISASATFDRSGSACDALSAAIQFVGEEAVLGEERDASVKPDPCDPATVDPALYECP